MVHFTLKRGAYKKENAQTWIKECLRKGKTIHKQPVVIVIDNAPCHNGLEDIFREDEFKEDELLRLAPYSPMFNPIENIWSIMKSQVKKKLAENMLEILSYEGGGFQKHSIDYNTWKNL